MLCCRNMFWVLCDIHVNDVVNIVKMFADGSEDAKFTKGSGSTREVGQGMV